MAAALANCQETPASQEADEGDRHRVAAHTRQVLTGGFGLAAGLVVGCGSVERDAAGWSFVDDRKHTVRLSRRPTRIVAYTSAAAALHRWGVTPVGVFGDDPGEAPELAGYPWRKSE